MPSKGVRIWKRKAHCLEIQNGFPPIKTLRHMNVYPFLNDSLGKNSFQIARQKQAPDTRQAYSLKRTSRRGLSKSPIETSPQFDNVRVGVLLLLSLFPKTILFRRQFSEIEQKDIRKDTLH